MRYAGPTTHEDWEFYNDILINDSPIEDSHVLLVPHRGMTDGSPQVRVDFVDLLVALASQRYYKSFAPLCTSK